MKSQKTLIGIAAVLVVGFLVGILVYFKHNPTGRAIGMGKKSKQLWQKLAQYENPWLRAWSSQLASEEVSDMEVLEAWNELAYQVTGRSGFWRDKVKNRWFGCSIDADTLFCGRLTGLEGEFAKWDTLQEEIANLPEKRAREFITKNYGTLEEYLSTMVPTKPSSSEMQETKFFKDHLQDVFMK